MAIRSSFILGITTFVLLCPSVLAHSGGTDANGCHTNKKTGEYHCHNKPFAKEAKTDAKTSARSTARGASECSANIYNCADFSSHSEAQLTYEKCLDETGRDVHDLDRDSDGVACEALQ